eukprot:scaffold17435_cov27-Prasinocladus_malaysianus.AAC.1
MPHMYSFEASQTVQMPNHDNGDNTITSKGIGMIGVSRQGDNLDLYVKWFKFSLCVPYPIGLREETNTKAVRLGCYDA